MGRAKFLFFCLLAAAGIAGLSYFIAKRYENRAKILAMKMEEEKLKGDIRFAKRVMGDRDETGKSDKNSRRAPKSKKSKKK